MHVRVKVYVVLSIYIYIVIPIPNTMIRSMIVLFKADLASSGDGLLSASTTCPK